MGGVCLSEAVVLIFILLFPPFFSMPRHTQHIELPRSAIGSRHVLQVHNYGVKTSVSKRAYIQSSLHADELPGMLVSHHLIHLLDTADKEGHILEHITIVPYANPIGLSQNILGSQIGRFSLQSGINFNRNYPNISEKVALKITEKLTNDANQNVMIIREAIEEELSALKVLGEEDSLKNILYKIASQCDIVLDLHCDSDAILHIYTHCNLWPTLSSLAQELRSEVQLLAITAGGTPFDDACSCPWDILQKRFPLFPIPMACESSTVELRGESDLSDELAMSDAKAIFRFLQRRGYICPTAAIEGETLDPLIPELKREATMLSDVDMVEAEVAGIVVWKVKPGETIKKGDTLGEIVDIENPDAERTPVVSRTDGVVFSVVRHRLVRPGQVIIKVAGSSLLLWRTGNLLTSK